MVKTDSKTKQHIEPSGESSTLMAVQSDEQSGPPRTHWVPSFPTTQRPSQASSGTPIFALLETDALQRTCTLDAVTRLGYKCEFFFSLRALTDAVRSGLHFDVIGIAIHPDQTWTSADLQTFHRSGLSRMSKLVLMAHHTEFGAVHPLVLETVRHGSAQFIRTPVLEEELVLRLNLLDPTR
ncbi:UNVERIFIED_ORG: hypothetical protein J2W38_007510 [Variovorax paradoxus]|jgi:hypothetical protein|nr:hypothetical protein [Variovorax paradoxus]